ncbi:MAG: hypothetical protein R3Y54_10075 [Eubacteriales bacterium]
MPASIYMNSDIMQVVCNKGNKITKSKTAELPEGTVLNGVIIKPDHVVEQLVAWRRELKLSDVSLVLDSSNIHVKKMILPNLPKQKLLPIVRSEFDFEGKDDYFFDYNIIEKGKHDNAVLGCGAPIELIEKYLKCFDDAKITVADVDVIIDAVINYVSGLPESEGRNLLINILHGHTLLTVLFREGSYVFSNRNRIISKEGSEEYIGELYEKLSAMIQFSKSQQTDFLIQKSVYVGLDSITMDRFKRYVEAVQPLLGIVELEDSKIPEGYFYAAIPVLNKKSDINLKRIRKSQAQKMAATAKPIAMVAGILVCATPLMLWYGNKKDQITMLEKQAAVYDDYLLDASTQASLAEVEAVELEIRNIKNTAGRYEKAEYVLSSHAYLDVQTLKDIYEEEGIFSEKISYVTSTATISVNGVALERLSLNEYLSHIRNNTSVDYLVYSGYDTEYEQLGTTSDDLDDLPIEWSYEATWDLMISHEEMLAILEAEAASGTTETDSN